MSQLKVDGVSIRAGIYKKLHPKMTWGSLDPMCPLRVKIGFHSALFDADPKSVSYFNPSHSNSIRQKIFEPSFQSISFCSRNDRIENLVRIHSD